MPHAGPAATDPTADELRRRAAELRRLAHHLDATPLPELARWAGHDTWVSPRADELRAGLAVHRSRLQVAADDLRLHARWLERQADAVEVAASLAAAR